MPIFRVLGVNLEDGGRREFYVDNQTLKISKEKFKPSKVAPVVDLAQKAKDGPFQRVKIQLGLNCNFDCSYCSQKSSTRTETFRVEDIPAFVQQFEMLPVEQGARIEMWGGEPLVYFKVLKPLTDALRAIRPDLAFSIITNGSLLTKPIVQWLYNRNFNLSISHDGPGQSERGSDPLETNKEAIEYAISLFAPKGRFSFNAVLNVQNQSRKAIVEWFEARYPNKGINYGELDMVSAYDPQGVALSKMSDSESYAFRREMWLDLRHNFEMVQKCMSIAQSIQSVIDANGDGGARVVRGTKCGMEQSSAIALDLAGRVLTCQNISPLDTAPNGEAHLIGTVETLDTVRMKTAVHWSQRDNCSKCPVLKLCRGSCMFLVGEHFDVSCASAYSEAAVIFALGFEAVTGYMPVRIEQEDLPELRRDLFGPEPTESAVVKAKPRKIIPIKSVQ